MSRGIIYVSTSNTHFCEILDALLAPEDEPETCVAVVEAYQYSSITSITLLDCWTVLWVIILTWYVLGTRYSFWQFLGAGTCIAGLCLVLLSDAKSPDVQGKVGNYLIRFKMSGKLN
jgi:hypothetical protein